MEEQIIKVGGGRRVMAACAHRMALLLALLLAPGTTAAADLIIWANNGEDKITQDDLRGSVDPAAVHNSVWNGSRIRLFGARNETVSFCMILESGDQATSGVSVVFDTLTGPGGATIRSLPASGDGVLDYVDRPIELFFVRYLQVRGVGRLVYEHYDERHVPERLRRPWSGDGVADPGSGWTDRPDHDKYYPDIAVPLELETPFAIAAGQSQCIWVDIYIPKATATGLFQGTVTVAGAGQATQNVPVSLDVLPFALPDEPHLKVMLAMGYEDVNNRYVGIRYPLDPAVVEQMRQVRDRHFQMAHRHRISIIDADSVPERDGDPPHPSSEWLPRLNGSLFAPARGYDGPGVGIGNNIYSVGLYGFWWSEYPDITEAGIWARTDAWSSWFAANAPQVKYHLYIVDEQSDPASIAKIERWSSWIDANPGPGSAIESFATMDYIIGVEGTPSLDIPCATNYSAPAADVQAAADAIFGDPGKRLCWYNGWRPYLGTFATEDDGVALRASAWAFFKKKIERWFYWESTYYNNFQGGTGETDVFNSAFTFGADDLFDPVFGRTGSNYSNGDGVLFYPGTDTVFPAGSYGLSGPIASLRLKHWRRGIQDADYLAMAEAVDAAATRAIVDRIVPKVMWEYGVTDPQDPTFVITDLGWSTDPDLWEQARAQLACIIQAIPPQSCAAQANVIFADGFESGDTSAWSVQAGGTGAP